MNIVLWVVQILLALLYFAGGAYKTFMFGELAGQFDEIPRGIWPVFGVIEMVGAVLLVVPAALKWMPFLTPLAAAVLTLETLVLAGVYARHSLALSAENALVWAVAMALLVAFVAYGRYARTGFTAT